MIQLIDSEAESELPAALQFNEQKRNIWSCLNLRIGGMTKVTCVGFHPHYPSTVTIIHRYKHPPLQYSESRVIQ